jgi:hypothetical protein
MKLNNTDQQTPAKESKAVTARATWQGVSRCLIRKLRQLNNLL